jgi:hypothetical protein
VSTKKNQIHARNQSTSRERFWHKIASQCLQTFILTFRNFNLLHTVDSDSSGHRHRALSPEAKTAQKCKHLIPPSATGTFQHPFHHQHIPWPLLFFGTQLPPTPMTLSSSMVIHVSAGVANIGIDFCTACCQRLPAIPAELVPLKPSSDFLVL